MSLLKFCGDISETTAFTSYGMKHKQKSQYANFSAYPRSVFKAQRSTGGYRVIINNIQPCLKQYLLMQLAFVRADEVGSEEHFNIYIYAIHSNDIADSYPLSIQLFYQFINFFYIFTNELSIFLKYINCSTQF